LCVPEDANEMECTTRAKVELRWIAASTTDDDELACRFFKQALNRTHQTKAERSATNQKERGRSVNTNSPEQKQRLASAGESSRIAKRPYVKPEVRCEHVFETMALSCGKVHTTQSTCHFNRKTS